MEEEMKIAVAPGDGIGKEVTPVAEKAVRHYLPDAEYLYAEVGYGRWEKTGEAISDDDIKLLKESDAVLFGAITTVPDPGYKSVILRIRKELDLYANLRPVYGEGFDIEIVRENTEGLYSGIEETGDERSTTLRVVTRKGSERIAEFACRRAKLRRGEIVIGNKANVLKSDALFRDTCIRIAEENGIASKTMYIDALALDVLMHPKRYDVIVTTNIFGDILSDVCGFLTGGLGTLPSGNYGTKNALFEPVHGSAPDIAGKGIANPVAALRSAGMLLDYLGIDRAGSEIEESIQKLLKKGISTPDLGGDLKTSDFGEMVIAGIMR
jgi:methanogen homoisocitrate dehydrogenase